MLQTETAKLRKITVQVPAELLEDAQELTGGGVTETITAGLEKLAASRAYRKLLALEGSCKIDLDLEASRLDRKSL